MRERGGFTIMEMMVVTAAFLVVAAAGHLLLLSGQSAWSVMDSKVHMQDSLRKSLLRISGELQQSGEDSGGVMQVTIVDGGGAGSSDILRFSVPICPCGVRVMDDSGEVKHWGAPLVWGQNGCNDNYPLEANGKVDICHLPPGNPSNEQALSVNVNAVKAHLAHNDRLGDCASCDPDVYSNVYVEYQIDASGRLWRRILDAGLSVVKEEILADSFTDFQASFNAGQSVVTLDAALSRSALTRNISLSGQLDVVLRNK